MKIQVLPQTLINQIAAGEVVVRMASAVKELVENSIDAGARHIEVRLSNNARDLEVIDDGCGMSAEDAELALQRHATSKIRSADDLAAIHTRGFRGEALPSIASVSRMEIRTREHGQDAGSRIQIDGGRILRIEPAGCPTGTHIIVRDLFYNTPARLKFLKSVVSETNAIMTLITRHAMATPSIGYRVEKDGKETLHTPPGQSLEDRFRLLLGSQIKRAMMPLFHEREGACVEGWLAHPLDARGDRRGQFLFVNGRPFTSKTLSASFEQACRGFVMTGRFPVFCLFIEVPFEEVDINVHPTKEEVRFRDERTVAGAVYRGAQYALEGSRTLVGEMRLERENPQEAVDSPAQKREPNAAPPSYFQSPEQFIRHSFDRKRAVQRDWTAEAEKFHTRHQEQNEDQPAEPPAARRRTISLKHDHDGVIAAGPGERPDRDFWATGWELEPLGQIAETYIAARYGEDLLLIDQHASHERLRYLELKKQDRAAESQRLLIPITIEVTAAQATILHTIKDQLADIGFEISEFGPRAYAVESLPADLPEFDPVPMLLQMIDDADELGASSPLDDLRESILIRAACHSAIRAGEQLPMDTMRELLRQIREERLSLTCPHGRPTIVRLNKTELDKQFKRIV